jgi:hypothetical protein
VDPERCTQAGSIAQTARVSLKGSDTRAGITTDKVFTGRRAHSREHGNTIDEEESELCIERPEILMANMTEEEYRKFKETTGFKEPQTIKTYYKEAENHRIFLKHHAERREFNRTLRFQQSTIMGKLQLIRNSGRRYDGWPEY